MALFKYAHRDVRNRTGGDLPGSICSAPGAIPGPVPRSSLALVAPHTLPGAIVSLPSFDKVLISVPFDYEIRST